MRTIRFYLSYTSITVVLTFIVTLHIQPPAERSALYIPRHIPALQGKVGTLFTATSTRVGHHLFGKLTTPEDIGDDVARRQRRRLSTFNSLTTVTGHSSSCDSRQSIRNPEDTRIFLCSSPKKRSLGNDNRPLRTWYLVHIYMYRKQAYVSSTSKCTSTSTVAAVHVRLLVGITNTYLLRRTDIITQRYQPTMNCS